MILAAMLSLGAMAVIPSAPVIENAVVDLFEHPKGGWGVQLTGDFTIDDRQNTGAEFHLKCKPITATQWQSINSENGPTGKYTAKIGGWYGEHPPKSGHDLLLRVTNDGGDPRLFSDAMGSFTIPGETK